jgi:hypothetical protein
MRKTNNAKTSNVQNSTMSHGNIQNHMYFQMPSPSTFFPGYASTQMSPQMSPGMYKNQHRHPSTSPARSDPDGHAELDRYFMWLIGKYPADKERLLSAKDKLHDKDVDLKTLRKLELTILEAWGISWGVGDKIKYEIKDFQCLDIY